MKNNIKPVLGSGFRDYLPDEMIPRQLVLDTIRKSFELYGFAPMDTPAIEKEDILTGGDSDFRMNIFRINRQKEDVKFALRFDLTVPLARVISANSQLERPFKRYQVGRVWRGEKPQSGRFREFVQFDADTVGSTSIVSDAEIISLIEYTMNALNLNRFKIKINNRKVLDGLPQYLNYAESQHQEVLKSIDKLDKIGWDGVAKELEEKLSLSNKQISLLESFITIDGTRYDEALSTAESVLGLSDKATEGINELRKLFDNLNSFGVNKDCLQLDFSVARGLDYYTGNIFETILDDLPEIGSVFSGGRYDNLVTRFTENLMPAVGVSLGVDRLFVALDKLDLIKKRTSSTQVLVLNFDQKVESSVIEITTNLRKGGLITELYIGRDDNIKAQLTYALQKQIPFVVIMGENEIQRDVVQVKYLPTRNQFEVNKNQIVAEINKIISSQDNSDI